MAREISGHTLTMDQVEARLAKHRGELERAQEEYKTANDKEKAALRSEIEELKGIIAEDKKAKEQKEKDEGTGGTLVLPPAQAEQGQHHGDDRGRMDHADTTDTSDGGKRKGTWKKAW